MSLFEIIAVLITLSALFSWINVRFLRLPTAIGVMLMALMMSLLLISPVPLSDGIEQDAQRMLDSIDFDATLLHGMLSFLLFAGALHVKLGDLAEHRWVIGLLASAGVVLSTFIVGLTAWVLFNAIGLDIALIYCLLFGALISPTDPIAVLGILKSVGAPPALEIKITGESLFNDGVAVVVFLALFGIAFGGEQVTVDSTLLLFLREAIGGLALGLISGAVAYLMLRRIDNYQAEVLITLATASGGYALAEHLHISAPITVVVSGLFIGNLGRHGAMSDLTRQHIDDFWELVDEVLNAVLFVLIGLEVMVLTLDQSYLVAGGAAIPLVLLARAISVGLPLGFMRRFRSMSAGSVAMLTWGGLRGGISVAMALALPAGPERDLLVTVTYVVVVFSILLQGLTLAPLVRAVGARAEVEMQRAELIEPEHETPKPETGEAKTDPGPAETGR
jgi:CPA1 family monovalent cation:H+ antiporter